MNKGLINEVISWTFFIIGIILMNSYASWQLSLGIFLFVSSAKIDITHRIKKYIKDI